LDFGLK